MLTHFRIGDLDRIFSYHIGPRNLVTTYILDTSSSALVDQLFFVQIACPENISLKSDTSLLSGSSRESSAPRVGSKRTPPSSAIAIRRESVHYHAHARRPSAGNTMGIQRMAQPLLYGPAPILCGARPGEPILVPIDRLCVDKTRQLNSSGSFTFSKRKRPGQSGLFC